MELFDSSCITTCLQQQQQPFNGHLSGTTRVGRYQKKHSPAHTHPGQRTIPLSPFSICNSPRHPLYAYDMLSVDGDADAAVEATIRIGWNKFRQLVPLLTNKDVSLIMRGRCCTVVVYEAACCMEVRPGL